MAGHENEGDKQFYIPSLLFLIVCVPVAMYVYFTLCVLLLPSLLPSLFLDEKQRSFEFMMWQLLVSHTEGIVHTCTLVSDRR